MECYSDEIEHGKYCAIRRAEEAIAGANEAANERSRELSRRGTIAQWQGSVSEKSLQTAVDDHLKWHKIPYVRVHYRCPGCGFLLNGDMKGIPDNVFPAHGVELKKPGEYPTKYQRKVHEHWRNHGITVDVCRSLQEVIDALIRKGIT